MSGYYVFGRGKGGQSSVNQQIVIYVFARVVLGLAKLSVQRGGEGALWGTKEGRGLLGLSEGTRERVISVSWSLSFLNLTKPSNLED